MQNSGFIFTTIYDSRVAKCRLYASKAGDQVENYLLISEKNHAGKGVAFFRLTGFDSSAVYNIRLAVVDIYGNQSDLMQNYDGTSVPYVSAYIYGDVISTQNVTLSPKGEEMSSRGAIPSVKLDFKNGYVYFKRWTNRRYADRYDSIQAAYNDLPTSGGTVVLASKTYTISSSVLMSKEYTAIVGDSMASSAIMASITGQTGIKMTANHQVIENLKIDGVNGQVFDKGIWLNRSSYSQIRNVYIDKTQQEAIRFDYDAGTNTFSKENFIDTVYCVNNGNDGSSPAIMLNVCDNNYFNNIYIISCQVTTHGAVRVIQSDGITFQNSHISGSHGYGIEISSNTYNFQFLGGSIGGSYKHGVYISSGRDIYFGAGTRIHVNGQGALDSYYNVLIEPLSGYYAEDIVLDAFIFGPKEPQNDNTDTTCKVKHNVYIHNSGAKRITVKGKVQKAHVNGIYIDGGYGHRILADVTGNRNDGVTVVSGNNIEINGMIDGNGNNGLTISDENNRILGSTIINNGSYGIKLDNNADKIVISDSYIDSNDDGTINAGSISGVDIYVHDTYLSTGANDPNNVITAHDNY